MFVSNIINKIFLILCNCISVIKLLLIFIIKDHITCGDLISNISAFEIFYFQQFLLSSVLLHKSFFFINFLIVRTIWAAIFGIGVWGNMDEADCGWERLLSLIWSVSLLWLSSKFCCFMQICRQILNKTFLRTVIAFWFYILTSIFFCLNHENNFWRSWRSILLW